MRGIAAALAAAALLAPAAAGAQTWPAKPIKTIQTLGTGGGAEVIAHTVAQRLSEVLGQSVVVEPVAGAGGALGMNMVARAAPDGYTIGLGSVSSLVLRHFLTRSVPYDTLKDFTPVILVSETVSCVVASPATDFTSMADVIGYARRNPGKLAYGSSGVGTTHHLSGVMVEQLSGTQMLHVPYKGGGQSLQGLMSGQVQIVYGIVGSMAPLMKSGKIRMIAINASDRFKRLPDIATIGETVKGYDRPPSWNGYLGPAGLPANVTRRLYEEINRIANSTEVSEKLADLGFLVETKNPQDFTAYIRQSFELFARAVKAAGLKPE